MTTQPTDIKIAVTDADFHVDDGTKIDVTVTGGFGGTVELWKNGATALEQVLPIEAGAANFICVNTPYGCYYVVARESPPSTHSDIRFVDGATEGCTTPIEIEIPLHKEGGTKKDRTIRVKLTCPTHRGNNVTLKVFSKSQNGHFNFADPLLDRNDVLVQRDVETTVVEVPGMREEHLHVVVFMMFTDATEGTNKRFVKCSGS